MAEIFVPLLNSTHHEEYLQSVFQGYCIDDVELDIDEGGSCRSVILHLNDGRSVMIGTPSDEGLVLAEAGLSEA